jgi:DNA-binding transcriptional LysR family regulator
MVKVQPGVVVLETQVNLRDLRAFCSVIEQGSITAAARDLGESKGAVSRRVSRLEEKLGIALIQRVGGRAQATSEGISYRQRAAEALEILDTAQAELLDQEAMPQGRLRITALDTHLNSSHLSDTLGRFMDAYPKVSLDVLITGELLSFRDDQIDFAFRAASGQLPDSGNKAIFLAKIGLGFVASPEYLEKHGTPTHPGELSQHRLLTARAFSNGIVIDMQPCGKPEQAQQFELHGHLLCQDCSFLKEAAVVGGGIFIMPPAVQEPYLKTGQLVRVLADWESARDWNLYLVYPGRPLSPKAEVFKNFIKSEFGMS